MKLATNPYDLEHAGKWYEHSPQKVSGNEKVKILWDVKIQIDKIMEDLELQ